MDTLSLREDAAVAVGDVAVAALAWRFGGVLRVTVVAKATFAFAPDATMARVSPQPIVGGEVHHGGNPARSIRLTTDLAPYQHRTDVLLTGHAHAPNGLVLEALPVRLSIFDGGEPVVDKTVLVRKAGGMTSLPLMYERAYGGPGFPDNPFGTGLVRGSPEPNVVDPFDPKRLAGFAPIGAGWPARRRLLGPLRRLVLATNHVVDLPDEFDWSYLQAAPEDQRTGFLRGDEWIVLDGMHPVHPRLRTQLPGARGLGLVYGLSPWGVLEGQPIALHGDTLRIDVDEERVTLTCRAAFPLASEDALARVRVALGIELPGAPIAWPDHATFERASMPPSVAPESIAIPLSEDDFESVRGNVLMGTLVLEPSASDPDEAGAAPRPAPTVPFPRPANARSAIDALASTMTSVAPPPAGAGRLGDTVQIPTPGGLPGSGAGAGAPKSRK
jgi:hypothetical protein